MLKQLLHCVDLLTLTLAIVLFVFSPRSEQGGDRPGLFARPLEMTQQLGAPRLLFRLRILASRSFPLLAVPAACDQHC